jgi:hypothetical protein
VLPRSRCKCACSQFFPTLRDELGISKPKEGFARHIRNEIILVVEERTNQPFITDLPELTEERKDTSDILGRRKAAPKSFRNSLGGEMAEIVHC